VRVSLKLSIAALAVAACLAMVPAASATTIDLFVGTTEVATMTLTSGGSCASGDVCVTITGVNGNEIRTGGPTVGFSGSGVSASTGITGYTGSGNISSGTCGGMKAETVCFDVNGKGANGTFSSVTLVLTNAQLSSITDAGLHVVGPVCGTNSDGSFKTCFTTSSTVSTVPEPGTLGLLGTGLVGLAGLARRRFLS
jgi:PEP-CTERM motif